MTDAIGYVAAGLVLATFCAKQMVSLRALAISSNLAFITYGLAAQLWPILILHTIMLPLNILRLRDALASPGLQSRAGIAASGTPTGNATDGGLHPLYARRLDTAELLWANFSGMCEPVHRRTELHRISTSDQ